VLRTGLAALRAVLRPAGSRCRLLWGEGVAGQG
jgi:hypothetical protein